MTFSITEQASALVVPPARALPGTLAGMPAGPVIILVAPVPIITAYAQIQTA